MESIFETATEIRPRGIDGGKNERVKGMGEATEKGTSGSLIYHFQNVHE